MAKSKKILKDEQKLISSSLELYASFYPKYYLLETTLKGRLFNAISEKLGDDWFSNQIKADEKESLFAEEISFILRRKPKNFTLKDHGLLVESGLGFWVEFFNKRLYKMTQGIPLSIFIALPKEIKRKDLYQKLTFVKNFRNQLFHSRILPVTNHSQLNYLDEIISINHELMSLLSWLGITKIPGKSDTKFQKGIDQIRDIISSTSSRH